QENTARTGLSDRVAIEISDGAQFKPKAPVDAVLCDAPCSATGTIRRHPDLLHLKSARDVTQLIEVQTRLLDNAAAILKPGGTLIYCTCSLQKDEGERQVEKFLSAHAEFKRWPIAASEIGGLADAV